MFFDEKIWVSWKMHTLENGKKTKVPYQVNGKKASTTDPKTWSTFHEVKKVSNEVGIVFEPSVGIIGVDFDHCIKDGVIQLPLIKEFLEKADTYVEFSPSATGLHVLFQCKPTPILQRNKEHLTDEIAVEVYSNGRYFTFTGKQHPTSKKLRSITSEEFEDLIKMLGYPWAKEEVAKDSHTDMTGTGSVANVVAQTQTILDGEEIKGLMFASKNGEKIKALWEGDISAYSNDESSADFALCLHLAFWTGKDMEMMRALWLESPLGQRKKTQQRKDYQDRTLEQAVRSTHEVYTPRKMKNAMEMTEETGYIMSEGKNPAPLMILENICRVMDNDPVIKGKFRLNDFTHMTETIWDKNEWVNLYDGCIYELMRYISSNYESFRKVTKSMVIDAVLSVAYRNKVNPPREYFTSLVWDGKPRLNSWLSKVYGTPDDDVHQAMGSNWLKGLVKRVMRPGCIFDEVLVLEGKQGMRKSTSLRELGKPWHVETTMSMEGKDFYLLVAGNMIVEFSEGDIFDRNSMKTIKSEVTKTEDQFRPPYERGMMKFKRSCVFAMTSNKLELKDDTGNRRWLPVFVEKIADIDWIKENREQLFAEAYYRAIVVGEETYIYPKEGLLALQESRGEYNEIDEKLIFWYANIPQEQRDLGISLSDAVLEAYGSQQKVDKYIEVVVGGSLRRALKLENKNVRVKGTVVRRWKATEDTARIISNVEKNENIF